MVGLGLMGLLACGIGSDSPTSAPMPAPIPTHTLDVKLIRARLEEQGRVENASSEATIKSWLGSLKADGSWPDVDYANKSFTSWAPAHHVSRLASLASAYGSPGHIYYQNELLAQAFSKALDFWIAQKLVCPNWWFNDVGVPSSLGPALILMQPRLTAAQVTAGAALLPVTLKGTGENLMSYCVGTSYRALLESNDENLLASLKAIKSTLVLTSVEGIQVDSTFYQHGNQLYNGGYGLEYMTNITRWVPVLSGTEMAIEGSSRDNLDSLVLDGFGWMMRNGTVDFSVVGRGVSRQVTRAATVQACLKRLIAAGGPRSSELQALSAHVAGDGEGPAGHKHFWRGDYTVQRQAGAMVSLRLFSSRTCGAESINDENLLGVYQAYGTTMIYRDGLEYSDIFPAWNWLRLPGTTLEQVAVVPTFTGSPMGSQSFIGGVSDGHVGLSVFDQSEAKSSVKARKSWFFFGDGFLALGAGIQSNGSGSVFTTLNQCLLRGPVQVGSSGKTSIQPNGESDLAATTWVLHDGVGYVFPTPSKVHLKNASQSGDWGLINKMYPNASLSCDVFLLGLDHGVAPGKASYAYVVLPGTNEAAISAFASHSPLTILANTPALQAVRHADLGLSGIAFFTPGSVSLRANLTVSTDAPMLLLVRETAAGLELSVSDPTQAATSFQLTLSGKFAGTGAIWDQGSNSTHVTITLPTAEQAGSSVKTLLAKG